MGFISWKRLRWCLQSIGSQEVGRRKAACSPNASSRAQQNWANNGSVRRPNGKAAILITSYHWLHSNGRSKARQDVSCNADLTSSGHFKNIKGMSLEEYMWKTKPRTKYLQEHFSITLYCNSSLTFWMKTWNIRPSPRFLVFASANITNKGEFHTWNVRSECM